MDVESNALRTSYSRLARRLPFQPSTTPQVHAVHFRKSSVDSSGEIHLTQHELAATGRPFACRVDDGSVVIVSFGTCAAMGPLSPSEKWGRAGKREGEGGKCGRKIDSERNCGKREKRVGSAGCLTRDMG